MRSARTECLDHLLILNERHLRRVLVEYVAYFTLCLVKTPSATEIVAFPATAGDRHRPALDGIAPPFGGADDEDDQNGDRGRDPRSWAICHSQMVTTGPKKMCHTGPALVCGDAST